MIRALDIDREKEATSGIPALRSDVGGKRFPGCPCPGRLSALPEMFADFLERPEVFVKEAIQEKVCRGVKRATVSGRVVVDSDCGVLSPDKETGWREKFFGQVGVKPANPRDYGLCEIPIAGLLTVVEEELRENRLGGIRRRLWIRAVLKNIAVYRRGENRNGTVRFLQMKEVLQTSFRVFGDGCREVLVLGFLGEREQSTADPVAVPVPELRGVGAARTQEGKGQTAFRNLKRAVGPLAEVFRELVHH